MSTETPPPPPTSPEGSSAEGEAIPSTPPAFSEVRPTLPPTPEEEAAVEQAEARLEAGVEAAREAQAEKPAVSSARKWTVRAAAGGAGAIGLTGIAEAAKLGGGAALTGAGAAAAGGSAFWGGVLKGLGFIGYPLLVIAALYKLQDLPTVLEKIGKGELKWAEVFSKGGGKKDHGGAKKADHGGGGHGGGGGHH
ncbi:MAG: hypothetical protein KBC38_03680 [Candidatus Pacebacteria bacterium]|nr:hypothetical protein [Candidatus Paceibacterota bacterium]MBP9840157.1 hypothetical protein [Candidatus Paceibacterota bacterium]